MYSTVDDAVKMVVANKVDKVRSLPVLILYVSCLSVHSPRNMLRRGSCDPLLGHISCWAMQPRHACARIVSGLNGHRLLCRYERGSMPVETSVKAHLLMPLQLP